MGKYLFGLVWFVCLFVVWSYCLPRSSFGDTMCLSRHTVYMYGFVANHYFRVYCLFTKISLFVLVIGVFTFDRHA